MVQGWRAGSQLPVVSLQMERVMGECPATGTKDMQEADGAAEEALAGRGGVAQPQGLQEQGELLSSVPYDAGTPGAV